MIKYKKGKSDNISILLNQMEHSAMDIYTINISIHVTK